MNLQSAIDQRLWAAVERSYEAGDYSGAISDSFYFLSDLIQEKSGLDSDGAALIGSAFGGENPTIKVNAFQTETDRSEQKGLEQILRGLYLGLRNPRSHEKREDTARASDAIISFVDFLVSLIDRSKSPFDIEQILKKAFDKHFAPTQVYADALVARIPARRRSDVLTEAFKRRNLGKLDNVRLFVQSLIEVASEETQEAFWKTVSDALEEANSDADIRSAVVVTGDNWPRLSEVARLRIENLLIASIDEGEYDEPSDTITKGSLGAWGLRISEHFLTRDALLATLGMRLATNTPKASAYVLKYFGDDIIDKTQPLKSVLAYRLKRCLDSDDRSVHDALWFIGTDHGHSSWNEKLGKAMEDYETRNPPGISDSDIPF